MPDLSRVKNPDSFAFMNKARQMVYDRIKTRTQYDSPFEFGLENITVHWFRKTTDSWEVHMTTSLPDSIFYAVIHDQKTKTTTFDVYHKFDSQTFPDQESY